MTWKLNVIVVVEQNSLERKRVQEVTTMLGHKSFHIPGTASDLTFKYYIFFTGSTLEIGPCVTFGISRAAVLRHHAAW